MSEEIKNAAIVVASLFVTFAAVIFCRVAYDYLTVAWQVSSYALVVASSAGAIWIVVRVHHKTRYPRTKQAFKKEVVHV